MSRHRVEEAGAGRAADVAGGGRLASLRELAARGVPHDFPDVRGWEVRATDGRAVGELEDLLVDVALMRLRYVVVRLHRRRPSDGGARRVLVPVGIAWLSADADHVLIEASAADEIGVIAPDRDLLSRATPSDRCFDEQRFLGARLGRSPRRVDRGRVDGDGGTADAHPPTA